VPPPPPPRRPLPPPPLGACQKNKGEKKKGGADAFATKHTLTDSARKQTKISAHSALEKLLLLPPPLLLLPFTPQQHKRVLFTSKNYSFNENKLAESNLIKRITKLNPQIQIFLLSNIAIS